MWRFILYMMGFVIMTSIAGCLSDNQCRDTQEQNMALIHHVHEEMAKGNIDVFDEVLSPNYVRHCQAMPPELQEMNDPSLLKAFCVDYLAGVSDHTDTLTNMIADGDKVAYISTMTGTHTGTMNGIPATGKKFKLVNIIIQRFENGKIVETWVSWDNVAMLSQLGLFPPPVEGTP